MYESILLLGGHELVSFQTIHRVLRSRTCRCNYCSQRARRPGLEGLAGRSAMATASQTAAPMPNGYGGGLVGYALLLGLMETWHGRTAPARGQISETGSLGATVAGPLRGSASARAAEQCSHHSSSQIRRAWGMAWSGYTKSVLVWASLVRVRPKSDPPRVHFCFRFGKSRTASVCLRSDTVALVAKAHAAATCSVAFSAFWRNGRPRLSP